MICGTGADNCFLDLNLFQNKILPTIGLIMLKPSILRHTFLLPIVLLLLVLSPVYGWQDPDKNIESEKLVLLGKAEIQKDLEISGSQKDELQALQKKARGVYQESFSAIQDQMKTLSRSQQKELMQKTQASVQEKLRGINAMAGDILLPQQTQRLEQILIQQKIRGGGTNALLESKFFCERVGLTEQDTTNLRDKEKEVIEKLELEIKELKT